MIDDSDVALVGTSQNLHRLGYGVSPLGSILFGKTSLEVGLGDLGVPANL